MMYKTIKRCRLCASPKLEEIFSLGDLYINAFVAHPLEKAPRAPLVMVFCRNCSLVQLKHTADFQSLYINQYWYRSGLNPVITADLRGIARTADSIASFAPGDTFLDIGANDGTLLSFVPSHYFRIGVEPARNLIPDLNRHTNAVYNSFWEDVKELPEGRKAKVITAIAMLYDLDDPNSFMQNVKRHLATDGVFITQLMTLRPMLEQNDIGNVCHEHLEFYSYPVLKYLFEKNGLEIFSAEENDMNGGSYRLFARHLDQGSINHPEKTGLRELHAFVKRAEKNKRRTVKFIKKEVSRGKEIYGYGASTKGNTILQWYGLDRSLIRGVADKNPEKWGKFTVGTGVPIVSEEEARKQADYFFVLPWGFLDTFLEREKGWREGGGKFMVSIPEFKVV